MQHYRLFAAAIALSVVAAASPAMAQGVGTFDAWGHTFDRTPTLNGIIVPVAPKASDVQTTGSLGEAGRAFHLLSGSDVPRYHGTRGEPLAD